MGFRKLLGRFLRYLLDEEKPVEVSPIVEVLVPSKEGPIIHKYKVEGMIGLRLQGFCVSGHTTGLRLIGRGDCVNPLQFDELAQKYLGVLLPVWEDTREPVQINRL